ncbi:MAG: hypothetical protein AB7G75_11030 [Candidatus Binatia bacterium]
MTTTRYRLQIFFAVTVVIVLTGKAEAFLFWADIPKSAFPATIERTFPTPVDVTWKAALHAAQQEGALITADEEAGVIVYGNSQESPTTRTYMNILLRQSETTAGTVVYVLPQRRGGGAQAGADQHFLEKLRSALEVTYAQ